MKLIIQTVLFAIIWAAMANAECPAVRDVPTMFNKNYFTCAKTWSGYGPSSGLPVDACNTCYLGTYDIYDGEDMDAPDGRYWPMGSILVKAGCTLTLYIDHYSGEHQEIRGPITIASNNWGRQEIHRDGCGRGPRSFHCRCDQKPITCTPHDSFSKVLSCDNTDSKVPTTCYYEKKIGSSYTQTVEQSMQIDMTIEYELKSEFFGLFEEKLGISVTTGYNWKEINEETKSNEETFKVPGDPTMTLK